MPIRASGKYPNEIVDTPIVNCEPDRIVVKIRTSTANPSHIYAEDFYETPKCTVRNQNKIVFPHGDCGMTTEHMDNPAGTMYRICLSVQIHPLFVTDSDRSYCAQCVYMEANVVDDLEQNISIREMAPNELDPQFDEASAPRCSYSIRKGTVDGPEVHAAVVGETVFHVWQCNNENVGILVQNCHVEDLQGDKILIIDQNGCGVDQYLFRTPQYSNDLHTAFIQSNVFKFVDKSMTRFRCQLRLCVKNRGRGCESITPPINCPSIDDADSAAAAVLGMSATSSMPLSEEQRPLSASVHPNLLVGPARRFPIPGPKPPQQIGGPPSGRVEPPSVGPLGARAPGSTLISGGSGFGPPGGSVGLTVGPPSIRPFVPSTNPAAPAQPPSAGKPSAMPPSSSASLGISTTTRSSNVAQSPRVFDTGHQSGYLPYRSRRSTIMLYGSGSGPVPPLAERLVQKREMNRVEGTKVPARNETVERRRDQLDVVGLIRVLDNPEDLEYYDQSRSNNSNSVPPPMSLMVRRGSVVTAQRPLLSQQPPSLQLSLMPSPNLAHDLPSSTPASPDAPLPTASRLIVVNGKEGLDQDRDENEPQKCMSTSFYWALICSLGALLSVQILAAILVLVDRLLLDRRIAKKMNRVLGGGTGGH